MQPRVPVARVGGLSALGQCCQRQTRFLWENPPCFGYLVRFPEDRGQLSSATGAAQAPQGWTPTTLGEKLVKIGASVVSHAKYLVFQLAEAAVPRQLFAALVERIGRLRLVCASG
jgi:hypothetical protein